MTENVFSHHSKLELVETAVAAGYLVTLHVVLVPEALAVARVASRVSHGGHTVPSHKIRERHQRLWPLAATAIGLVDQSIVYDNTNAARPFRTVAAFERGRPVGTLAWPPWTPEPLKAAGRPPGHPPRA